MPLRIDHISMASSNIFKAAHALYEETGLGYFSGEWRGFSGVQIFPLGPPGVFLEIGGLTSVHALKPMDEFKQWLLDITRSGDCFDGLCLGVDTMEELEKFAKHFGSPIVSPYDPNPAHHFQRPDGYLVPMTAVPEGRHFAWMKGVPNIYYYAVNTNLASGQPVHPNTGMVTPTGIRWVECGGTEKQMADWLGIADPGAALNLRFNGKSPGVWAVGIGVEGRPDIIIRRTAASAAAPVSRYID